MLPLRRALLLPHRRFRHRPAAPPFLFRDTTATYSTADWLPAEVSRFYPLLSPQRYNATGPWAVLQCAGFILPAASRNFEEQRNETVI
jgi:hypothetical protein